MWQIFDSNYFLEDGKAFTEDGIVVETIYIHKIPRITTEPELREYFATFGEIKKVVLATPHPCGRNAPKFGFITYDSPYSASTALISGPHKLHNKKIGVKAADSWRQPDGMKKNYSPVDITEEMPTFVNSYNRGYICEEEKFEVFNTPKNIMDLNDDSLEGIFQFLELGDQISFSRVCRRFRSIFDLASPLAHRNISVNELANMTLWEMYDLFKFSGRHIRVISGSLPYDNERVMELISKYCTKIQKVAINNHKLRTSPLTKMLRRMNLLTCLKLDRCCITDTVISKLRFLRHLTELSVEDNLLLTGKYFQNLKQITKLNINHCVNIENRYMIDIFRSYKGLRVLNIKHCDRLTTATFDQMSILCLNLEELKITGVTSVGYEAVALIPKLKRLEVCCYLMIHYLRHQLFDELVAHAVDRLETLVIASEISVRNDNVKMIANLTNLKTLIMFNCANIDTPSMLTLGKLPKLEHLVFRKNRDITNGDVLSLIQICPKLKHLNIEKCKNITDVFIFELIEVLSKRPEDSPQLKIHANQTSITKHIVNNLIYAASKRLVQVDIGPNRTNVLEDYATYDDFPLEREEDEYDSDSESDEYPGDLDQQQLQDYWIENSFSDYDEADALYYLVEDINVDDDLDAAIAFHHNDTSDDSNENLEMDDNFVHFVNGDEH